MRVRSICAILLTWFLNTSAQEQLQSIQLGKDTISLLTIRYKKPQPGIYFIHLHENEQTALRAGKHYVRRHGGVLITLMHGYKRNVQFASGDSTYTFDPNRIFSEEGINRTLARLSSPDSLARETIHTFADTILAQLLQPKLVIAIHNNTKGLPLSINTYPPEQRSEIYINPKASEDNFVLTTDKNIFDYLKKKRINIVLQYASNTADDGSLSIYFSKAGVPYLNIETEHGHYRAQKRILRKIKPLIKKYKSPHDPTLEL